MKLIVDISPESRFNPATEHVVPADDNAVGTEFLEWLHAAAAVSDCPPWVGSFDDVEVEDRDE